MPLPSGEIRSEVLAPLTGTLGAGSAATTVKLKPTSGASCMAFRVKRLGSSVGDLRWGLSGGADATHGYLLTDLDPDSGWIYAQTDAIDVYATSTGAVDYEIMRLS